MFRRVYHSAKKKGIKLKNADFRVLIVMLTQKFDC